MKHKGRVKGAFGKCRIPGIWAGHKIKPVVISEKKPGWLNRVRSGIAGVFGKNRQVKVA